MTCTETRASQVRLKQKHEWQTAWKLNVTEVEKLNVVKAAVEKKRKLFVTEVEKLNDVKAAVEKKMKLFVTGLHRRTALAEGPSSCNAK